MTRVIMTLNDKLQTCDDDDSFSEGLRSAGCRVRLGLPKRATTRFVFGIILSAT